METKKVGFKRKLIGEVTSNKAQKTITVTVERRYKHPLYSKFVHRRKKYHAHDENQVAALGNKVLIVESKPYSKQKTWELVKVLS